MTPRHQARQLLAERFPEARAAYLGGSAARGTLTPTSDLDVVVVRAEGEACFRETLRVEGRVVELFVHTPSSLERWYGRDRAARVPVLAELVATGLVLADEGEALAHQERARRELEHGPEALSREELDLRRYLLTDSVADLSGLEDPAELLVVATVALTRAAELALLVDGCWLARGKWLFRRLAERRPGLAAALVAGVREVAVADDSGTLVAACDEVLAFVGGRLDEGYRVAGDA